MNLLIKIRNNKFIIYASYFVINLLILDYNLNNLY